MNEEKEGRSERASERASERPMERASEETEEAAAAQKRVGGGNRELTSLIHLLVAFPVYILLPAESTSAFKD